MPRTATSTLRTTLFVLLALCSVVLAAETNDSCKKKCSEEDPTWSCDGLCHNEAKCSCLTWGGLAGSIIAGVVFLIGICIGCYYIPRCPWREHRRLEKEREDQLDELRRSDRSQFQVQNPVHAQEPGWFDAPSRPGMLCWWDGTTWTNAFMEKPTDPMAAQPPPPPRQ